MIRVLSFLLVLLLSAGLFGGGFVEAVCAQDRDPSHAMGRVSTAALSPDVTRAAATAIHGTDREGKDGPMARIGSELALLYYQHQQQGTAGVRALREDSDRRRKTGGERERGASRVLSPISPSGQFVAVNAIASEDASRLLSDLRQLGLDGGATTGNLVSGRLPIGALREAARLSSLRGMVPSYARVHAGSVESEADTSHSVYEVRNDLELDGNGKKICVLSDSYNNSRSVSTTATDDVQSGDLPGSGNPEGRTTPVDVLDDSEAASDEGRAMLQLIHDLAPGAELGFHTAVGGLGAFVDGVRDLANKSAADDSEAGACDVIVDDIGYNIQPFYQDGPVANVVDSVVAEGVPYFSSAGNDGQNSYQAPFRSSGSTGVLSASSIAHDFNPGTGVDTRQEITIEVNGEFGFFTFQWTDPSSVVEGSAGADTDLDVALVDDTMGVVAKSDLPSIQNGVPFESLEFTNDGSIDTDGDGNADTTFHLVIEKVAGPDPDQVKYIYSGSDYSIEEYDTLGPTIYGHPMAEGAMAVAAAPFFNTAAYNPNADPAALEPFSSQGGISIRFDQNGNELGAYETRDKPDVTGTDGIDNTFFGFDIDLDDPDPHPNFFGTSAAAPNIAAIGALILQSRPGMSPSQVYDRLESTAADVTTRQTRENTFVAIAEGEDSWSGHGFVEADAAVPPPDVSNLASEAGVSSGAVQLTWDVRDDADIQNYQIDRRYFDGPFEPVTQTDGPPVTIENLGLGVFTFRIQWTRSDGSEGTRTVRDTLGFEDVTATVTETDEQGRGTVAVSWEVPDGTSGFGYRLERQVGGEGPFETLTDTTARTVRLERQPPGTYEYRVTAYDNQGNSLTSQARSAEVEFEGEAVAIGPYPNPVQEVATVDLTVQEGQSVTVEVFNTIGERLYRDRRTLRARSASTLRIDTSPWSSGMYFLRLQGDDFTRTRKLVVVR